MHSLPLRSGSLVRVARVAGLLSLCLACVSTAGSPDAAPSLDADDAMTGDVDAAPAPDDAALDETPPVDAGPRGLLFDPCTSDAQCPATNRARCLPARGGSTSVGYPRGLCTRTCTRDSDCADGRVPGVCATVGARARQCMPACSTRTDCRAAYACLDRSPQPWCTAFCVRDEDCGDGAVCDPWKNVCFAPPHTSTGGDNGAPCDDTSTLACKGYCQPEVIDRPTGYIGGQCFSQCVLPEGSATWPEVWRQVTCPDGSLCVPESGERHGHIAPCMPRCVRDADCRAGYACRHPLDTDPATNDGVCDLINCNDGLHDCPAGYTCDTDGFGISMSEPIGRCVAATAP